MISGTEEYVAHALPIITTALLLITRDSLRVSHCCYYKPYWVGNRDGVSL